MLLLSGIDWFGMRQWTKSKDFQNLDPTPATHEQMQWSGEWTVAA